MRRLLIATVALVVGVWSGGKTGAEGPVSLRDALALEAAIRAAIERAEPSIACILVSRSEEYRQLLGDAPPPDRPGELGGFDPRLLPPPLNPRNPRGSDRSERDLRLDLANPNHVPEAFGSGVVVDARGLVLTNYHVVRGATKVFVRLPGHAGSWANIHAADPRSDLAVLRLLNPGSSPLRPIPMGDGSQARKGQFVISLANPFAAGFKDGSPSASWGILSNIRRRAPGTYRDRLRDKTLHHFGTLLQTDARLNLGCSGGALLNLQGEMIGLTTALAGISGSETAGGFAVPMNTAMRRIIDKLKEGKEVEYGYLGVVPALGREDPAEGVVIQQVLPNSPADEARLQAGQVIVGVNGNPVREDDDLFLHVGTYLAGMRVVLDVRQDQEVRQVPVTLHKFYVPGPIIASDRPPSVRGLRVDYVSVLQQMLADQTPRFGAWITNHPGVFVTAIEADSPASRCPLQLRDVITHVADRPVRTPQEFYQAVRDIERRLGPNAPLELTVVSSNWQKGADKVTLK